MQLAQLSQHFSHLRYIFGSKIRHLQNFLRT